VSLRDIRVGLLTDLDRADVGGGDALLVTDPRGEFLDAIPEGWTMQLRREGGGVALRDGEGRQVIPPRKALVISPHTPGQFLKLEGKEYRGELWAFAGSSGLTVVNRLGLESYLAGVLSAEMGRREPRDQPALLAQAVVSRTFAVKNLGKREAAGFDLLPTVADQVYGGVDSETGQAWDAVRRTRHQVLTYRGRVIDPFFSSTCGGTTAAGVEVFRAAERPYLQSMPDVSPTGEAYCRLSPRFRWRQEWTGDQLTRTVRRFLPAVSSIGGSDITSIRDVAITERTGSGRVAAIAIQVSGQGGGGGAGKSVGVRGPDIRRVLRPTTGRLLLSAQFSLTAERQGGRVRQLAAAGAGAGHGVGFCQWGAVGRARAGQEYDEILAAYFPRTVLERLE
jgi:stage II sporulation protein D